MDIMKAENEKLVLRIWTDDIDESPREWDNLGKMICFHKRYNLGDKHNLNSGSFDGWNDIEKYLIKEMGAIVILPLRLYDHSGISMSVSNQYPYNDYWDSGQVGFIIATREDIKKEYGVKRISKKLKDKVKDILISEVNTYDDYLTGNIYGYTLEEKDKCLTCEIESTELIDSCGGFYGDKFEEDMKQHIDKRYHFLFSKLEDI